jgi:hypothetical protein
MGAIASTDPAGSGTGVQTPRLHLLTISIVHDQN